MEDKKLLVEAAEKGMGALKHPFVRGIGATTVAGGAIGSFFPIVGTVIGAGAGAIVGGVLCIASEIKNRNK
jgi:hypothetical protein